MGWVEYGTEVANVWYFAYGSNMQSETFRGRRGIEYQRALPARAAGWKLVFDKPPLLPVGESFANMIADVEGTVLGVAYEIESTERAHIELTEGVLLGNYESLDVEVEPLSSPDQKIAAFTLVSEQRDPSLRPSDRYMTLLVDGAIEHGLPEEYVAHLRGVPTVRESVAGAHVREMLGMLRRPRSDPGRGSSSSER